MSRLLIMTGLLMAAVTGHDDAPTWLAGCWQSADGGSREVWVRESAHALFGFSASARSDRIGFYELMRIHRDETGIWVFTAWPSGQSRTSFRAVTLGPDSIVFANPDHDYPQEVRYRRSGGRLEASVSLLNGEKRRQFDKVSCD